MGTGARLPNPLYHAVLAVKDERPSALAAWSAVFDP
jgi:hypothetical protein